MAGIPLLFQPRPRRTEPLPMDAGDLIVSAGPGLGVEVDEPVVERYPWIPGPWSHFRIDSPPQARTVTPDHRLKWQ